MFAACASGFSFAVAKRCKNESAVEVAAGMDA